MIKSKWLFGPQAINEINAVRKKAESDIDLGDEGFDAFDPIALHVLIGEDEDWLATGRLFDSGGRLTIGPLFIAPVVRDRGVDDLLARMLINKAFELLSDEVYTEAKEDEVAFYEGLNFVAYAKPYEKDRITYTPMKVTRQTSPIPQGCSDCSSCSGCQHA